MARASPGGAANLRSSTQHLNVRFTSDTLREALKIFNGLIPEGTEPGNFLRSVAVDDEVWNFDSDEEFFAKYRKLGKSALFNKAVLRGKVAAAKLWINFSTLGVTFTTVTVQHVDAPKIEEIFEVFERNLEASRLPIPAKRVPPPVSPTIFVGHGHSAQWRDLKDHLIDKQGYRVVAYEVGERAGHTIRDILQELLVSSSVALLVLTAEDETATGKLRPRQNVIHELGLFQGKLGFPRAIAVVEEGVEMLSNLDGVQQIRFSKDNIAEVYGDVIATLRREFGDAR
jgi:predicted nucleotide-binding protein